MTSPTLISPNTGNYRVGKGKVYVMIDDVDIAYRAVGNVSSLEITPTIEKLEHFSSMEGLKLKDMSIALSQGGTVKIVMEEFTPANLGIMLMGAVDEGASGGPTVEIMGTTAVTGKLKFISQNTIGPRLNVEFFNLSFTPSAALDLISDEFGDMELEAEILADTDGRFGEMQITNIDS